MVQFHADTKDFPLFLSVQTSFSSHPVSYSLGTRVSTGRARGVRSWIWPLISIWCPGWECVDLYLHWSISFHL